MNALLTAALRHGWLRGTNTLGDVSRNDDADKHAKRIREEYFRELARHWPDQRPGPTEPKPETVAEMVRANVLGELRELFESFIRNLDGFDEAYILRDVLVNSRSISGDLGEAFSYVLNGADTYLRVPWKHHKRIEAMVRLFMEDAQ